MMKRENYIKIFSCVLCLLMLLGLTMLMVSAEEDEYIPMEWDLDPDLEYIYGNGKRYDAYYRYRHFRRDAEFTFYFLNNVDYEGRQCLVHGTSADPHIVLVSTEQGYNSMFVDAEGQKILNDFENRTDCFHYLEDDDDNHTVIEREFVDKLDHGFYMHSQKKVDVTTLGEAEILEITVHDKTKLMAYHHGAIYIMPNGSFYYVCFEDLGNNFFDADGYFSYRSGSVPVYELDDKTCLEVYDAKVKMEPIEYRSVYEERVIAGYYDVNGDPIVEEYGPEDERVAVTMFVVGVVVAGIFAPTVLLILGFVWAASGKTGRAKCWYALSVSAAVWLFSGILFLLLVLV